MDKCIVIPAEIMKMAMQYIEKNSDILWNSGDKPTSVIRTSPQNIVLVRRSINDWRMTYDNDVERYPSALDGYNHLSEFIK